MYPFFFVSKWERVESRW